MATKPNRFKQHGVRVLPIQSHERKHEESKEQKRQREICLQCEEPKCKKGWCEKLRRHKVRNV